MNLTSSIETLNLKNTCITIGTFDGVHLGHQHLINQMVKKANSMHSSSVVITFWPHPAMYFQRVPLAHAICSPEERAQLIKELGVDEVLTLEFNPSIADLEASEFVQKLKTKLDMAYLFVGPNFALGKGRSGNTQHLMELSKELDFSIEIMEPYRTSEGMISSSQIRGDIRSSRIREANRKLGRAYSLSGLVVHGEHRGTKLGIPTANMQLPPERLLPANGVYITRAWIEGISYPSVTNIGVRPTFENPLLLPRVEPHLLDMQEQVYDKPIKLEFIDFLRPEIRFANSEELVKQIKKDISVTREVFNNES